MKVLKVFLNELWCVIFHWKHRENRDVCHGWGGEHLYCHKCGEYKLMK